ncbi:MAG TPA: hypothetical protein VFG50_01560 [Rhodothermales bacterium]|nr:hypothetical protein [Rhodothermales bacterium]
MRKPAFSTHLSVPGVPVALLIASCVIFLAACDSAGDNGPKPIKGLLVVSARANIFAAGAAEVPDLTGGGGLVPELIRLEDATYLTFTEVTDSVTPNITMYDFTGPEGNDTGETRMSSYGGITGVLHRERFMFLAGVFLGDAAPSPPAPDSLDLTEMGGMDEVKNVNVGQVFFIGDGRSASGKVQHFFVPAGATRLFLGFADHDRGILVPGYYDDNKGGIGVHYELHKGE